MKLLLDGTFPPGQIPILRTPFWEIERIEDPSITDRELIELAAREGYVGVAFVGTAALGRPEVLEKAIDTKVLLIVTETNDPIRATEYLRENLGRIRRSVGEATVVLAQSRKLIAEDARDLLARRQGS